MHCYIWGADNPYVGQSMPDSCMECNQALFDSWLWDRFSHPVCDSCRYNLQSNSIPIAYENIFEEMTKTSTSCWLGQRWRTRICWRTAISTFANRLSDSTPRRIPTIRDMETWNYTSNARLVAWRIEIANKSIFQMNMLRISIIFGKYL